MQKGFTLAETLITMAIIGVIMALSIPAVIQSTNDTKPLFKKTYNSVEEVVSELVNDTSLYPSGDLSLPASGTFCSNFFSKLNIIGSLLGGCTTSGATAVTTFNGSGNPTGTAADANTTNGMVWYNLHPTSAFVIPAADTAFTAAKCEGPNNGNLTAIPDGAGQNTCVKISVDVNGTSKGANTNLAQANRDIFTIYVTNTGKVTVKTSATNVYDEAYLLQN